MGKIKKLESYDGSGSQIVKVLSENEQKFDNSFKHAAFVKVFLSDITGMQGLSKMEHDIMLLMLKHIDHDNIISLSSYHKKEYCKATGSEYSSVNSSIYRLCQKGLFKSIDRGVHMANPKYFGKGRWNKIKSITIEYNEKTLKEIIVERYGKE